MKHPVVFFDKPENIRRLTLGFFAVLALVLAAEFFIHPHGHFAWEEMTFFPATSGFLACVWVIFTAKALRWALGRRETYYEPDSEG
jgi:hypothetical protein